uniref:Uncharacterized protein n=1 Tax=Arundo donax TaxID=35708 RepID=A0A0A9GWB0_ARUDO
MASHPRPHSSHPSASLLPLSPPPDGGLALVLEEEAAPSPSAAGARRSRRSPAM